MKSIIQGAKGRRQQWFPWPSTHQPINPSTHQNIKTSKHQNIMLHYSLLTVGNKRENHLANSA